MDYFGQLILDLASIYYNGKRIRKSTETEDKKLAEKIHAKVLTQLTEGKWFDADQSKTRTFIELKDKYIRERSIHKSGGSQERDRGIFKNLLSFFGDCALAEISSSRVNEYKNMRLQLVHGQTVKKELGVLRNAFNVTIREWEWLRENPVSRVSLPKDPPGRVRYLTSEEIERLLVCSEEWYKPVLIVALHTGFRQGNIISLTWGKINLFKRQIILDAAEMKNREGQGMPIDDTLFETLIELNKVRHIGTNLVFMRNGRPLYKNLIDRALRRACKKAGIGNFRFHDLRHTFASLLVQSGVDLYTVQKLMDHKDGRMTQRYAHLTQEKFVKAIKVLDKNGHDLVTVRRKKKGLVP